MGRGCDIVMALGVRRYPYDILSRIVTHIIMAGAWEYLYTLLDS